MSQRIQPDGSGAKSLFGKIRYRSLAILIMLTGAAGFVAALLMFEEQVLCLFGSTLITMAGLGVNIAARRMGLDPAEEPPGIRSDPPTGMARARRVPPALRERTGRKGSAPQGVESQHAAAEASASLASEEEEGPADAPNDYPSKAEGLVERVVTVLESQGARVSVINSRDDRCILTAVVEGGGHAAVLVLEGSEPVTVADARALLSMTTRTAGGKGYLISQAAIPLKVTAWAADRGQIRLLKVDALHELEI